MNLSETKRDVNPFHSAKIISHQATPDDPNTEAVIDIELFGLVQIRRIKVYRNRRGQLVSKFPNTFADKRAENHLMPAVWLSGPGFKIAFDQALDAALASNSTGVK